MPSNSTTLMNSDVLGQVRRGRMESDDDAAKVVSRPPLTTGRTATSDVGQQLGATG
jgi:hypothetical protein